MKSKDLLKAIGDIDERFIEEADMLYPAAKGKFRINRRISAIAASFAILVITGALALGGFFSKTPAVNNAAPDSVQSENKSGYYLEDANNAGREGEDMEAVAPSEQPKSASGSYGMQSENHPSQKKLPYYVAPGYPGLIWINWLSDRLPK